MREQYIKDGGKAYWSHGSVMELVYKQENEDGTHVYVTIDGKLAGVKNEDELSPYSSRFYRNFDKKRR